jgi:hypothetical protein
MESTLKSGGIGADGVAWGLSFPEPFTTSARGSKRKDVFRAEADRRRRLGLTGDSGFGIRLAGSPALRATVAAQERGFTAIK